MTLPIQLGLQTANFGPFTGGVFDSANPSIGLQGKVRNAKGVIYRGAFKFLNRAGESVALTLKDDQGSPANVTSVCAVQPFADRAIAVAHSTVTNKVYLYVLASTMDGWYNSSGVLQSNTTPQPVATIWTTIATSPDVQVAEGLGYLYIAHTGALDANGLYFATKQWDGTYPVSLTTLQGSGTNGSAGTDNVYALGVIAFQQHLWFAGYGSGNTGTTAYRPELLRYSQPNFAAPQLADSITLGDRVRSLRESWVGWSLAGNALIVGAPYLVTRITGYGRDSWYKQAVDKSHGFVGPKCAVSDGISCYYWSPRGPMRISDDGPSEPLWDGIEGLVASVINPEKTVASRDDLNNLVVFTVDTGSGVRTRCAYDTRRSVWLGPDDDWGVAIRCAGQVDPVKASTASGAAGPSGAPSSPSTSSIGATCATGTVTLADVYSSTQWEVQRQVDSSWTVAGTTGPGVSSFTFTGLTSGVAYQWRAKHTLNGQSSSYVGPVAGTQFTTALQLLAPSGISLSYDPDAIAVVATWTNSGETGASTEVWMAGPSSTTPLGTDYSLKATVNPGVASASIRVYTNGMYWVKERATESGVTASNYDGPAQLDVTIF